MFFLVGSMRFLRGRFQYAVPITLLCAILFTSLGFPVFRPKTQKSEERFPCESCSCNCSEAEHCWRACCCHTNLQKLQWAIDNEVEPPDYVVAAAREEASKQTEQICRGELKSELVATQDSSSEKSGGCSHCGQTVRLKDVGNENEDSDDQDSGKLIRITDLRKCQGWPPIWSVLAHGYQPLIRFEFSEEFGFAEWMPRQSDAAIANSISPQTPPPERV